MQGRVFSLDFFASNINLLARQSWLMAQARLACCAAPVRPYAPLTYPSAALACLFPGRKSPLVSVSSTVAGVTFPSVPSITSPTSVYRPGRGKRSQPAQSCCAISGGMARAHPG